MPWHLSYSSAHARRCAQRSEFDRRALVIPQLRAASRKGFLGVGRIGWVSASRGRLKYEAVAREYWTRQCSPCHFQSLLRRWPAGAIVLVRLHQNILVPNCTLGFTDRKQFFQLDVNFVLLGLGSLVGWCVLLALDRHCRRQKRIRTMAILIVQRLSLAGLQLSPVPLIMP